MSFSKFIRSIAIALGLALGLAVAGQSAHALEIAFPGNVLPSGNVGVSYTVNLTTTGAVGSTVKWSVTGGKLPSGLSIIGSQANRSTAITGTPKTAGVYTFVITAKDNAGSVSKSFSLTIQ